MNGVIFLILRILLATVLYIFLGWSFRLIWRDIKYQQEIINIRKIPSISLRINQGSSDRIEKYRGTEIIIGRDPACECLINSEKVSGYHAKLSFDKNQWWIEDLDSTNGSFINNDPVKVPTVVVDGDIVQCGDALMTIITQDE